MEIQPSARDRLSVSSLLPGSYTFSANPAPSDSSSMAEVYLEFGVSKRIHIVCRIGRSPYVKANENEALRVKHIKEVS